MEATLDEQDYQVIADKVLQQIRKEYDLVPKRRFTGLIVINKVGDY